MLANFNDGVLGFSEERKPRRLFSRRWLAFLLPAALLAVAWVWSFGRPQDPVTAPAAELPVWRALFVMAHPDDEFGVYGRTLQLRDQGTEIWCVWTIGGNVGRDTEATRAMAEAGIPESHLRFLKVGGLRTAESLRQVVHAISGFLAAHPCDEIYVPAFEGGHVQHDLTQFAVVQAVRRGKASGHVYEYPLYNLAGGRINLFRLTPGTTPVSGITLDPRRVAFIRGLTRYYSSQRHIMEGFRLFMPYSWQSQPRWREVPARDYTVPPYRGLLWHDADPRKRFTRSYRVAVCETVAEFLKEDAARMRQAGSPNDK